MCLAGSRAMLTVTFPTCTCEGETSVVAGGREGVAPALAEVLLAAPSTELTGEGLAAGLALTAGALDGAGWFGFATQPAASTRAAPAPLHQMIARLRCATLR